MIKWIRNKKALRIAALCLAGVLTVGATGTCVYAKSNKTETTKEASKETSDEKTTKEKLQDELEGIWQPAEESDTYKEETVYIMTSPSGESNKVIVSDWIKNGKEAATLTDYSELSDITEVKNGESYTEQNGSYVWQADGNDIYYQGTTDKKLPIELQITYTLDGKKVTPQELAGKSGHVVIRYDFKVTESEKTEIAGKQEEIVVPFTVAAGMILENDTFRNVEVSTGKVINDGDKTMVAGIAFPGMAQNLNLETDNLADYIEIEADVTDFSTKTSYCVAMNNLMKSLNLDDADSMDDLTDALDELTDAMDQLMDGSGDLYDGLVTLYDKSGELKDGVGELYDGAGQLKDGAEKLAKGSFDLKEGTLELEDGMKQLQSGLGQLTANNDALNSGAAQVFDTLLATATTQMNANEQLSQLGIQVNLTRDNFDEVLNNILNNMEGSVLSAIQAEVNRNEATITAGVTAVVKEQVINGVLQAMQAQGYPLTREIYDGVKAGTVSGNDAVQSAQLTAMVAAADQNIEAKMASDEIQATIAANVQAQKENLISSNLQAMSGSLSAGAAQIASLKASLDSYNTFYQGLLTYTAGVSSAKDGADKLLGGAQALRDGAIKLLDGSNDLYVGTEDLYDGVGKLNDGSDALLDGVKKLRDGSKEMKDGLQEFNDEGISKITDAFEDEDIDDIIDRLKATVNVSKDYRSFAGISDDMDGNVKFIYKIDGIEE